MTDPNTYTISELAQAADVTVRTIRYYTAEALLPPPVDARGRYALYSQHHLHVLRLIGLLKASYLPLVAIKARLAALTPQQVEQLLAEHERADTMEGADTPVEPSFHLVGPTMLRERSESTGYQLKPMQPNAAVFQARSSGGIGFHPPDRLRPAANPSSPTLGRTEALSSAESTAGTAQPAPCHEEEARWRHILLAPGVELHVREPLDATLASRIEQLIAQTKALFAPPEQESFSESL